MRSARLALVLLWATAVAACQEPRNREPVINVNSRYTVESIEMPEADRSRLSRRVLDQMQELVGKKLNLESLSRLKKMIRRELRARAVHERLEKGTKPEHVKVVLEIHRGRNQVDVALPKFVYHSRQGWTGAVEAPITISGNRFSFGLVSDGDALVERFAGIRASYQGEEIGASRVRLRFDFESYHQQWNRSTLAALEVRDDIPGIYRTRQNFQPVASIALAGPLSLEPGVSFQRFQTQFPAAHTEAANAVVNTLRYHGRWEGSDQDRHDLEAEYSLRAATRLFDSDFVYARHLWRAGYSFHRGRQMVRVEFQAGTIGGQAPLFERFVAGNSTTLRGWNKFDLDPLGGERLAHGSLEYRYRCFRIFYDAGSVWDRGQHPIARHSIGLGLFAKDNFTIAVAFPVKDGRATPMVVAGMNF